MIYAPTNTLANPNVPGALGNPNPGSILGTDLKCIPDLYFVPVTGYLNLSYAILRRWQTPRGGLFYDPDYGTDLRDWVNQSSAPAGLFRLASSAANEAEKDPRVVSCACQVVYDPNGPGFNVTAQIVTGTGPFALIAGVSQIGVTLLRVAT